MLVGMGVGRIFSKRPQVDFSRRFSRGAKNGEIFVLPLELRKQTVLLKFSNSCPPSDIHACV